MMEYLLNFNNKLNNNFIKNVRNPNIIDFNIENIFI